eukprot:TRINITY_DN561_c0_g1_i2.p2 TRINITY_DN561_c0_g1~~TRINITY_DN561_c0_g1_i2.p2  ORF type:complete len:176 (+),score=8.19 TRINITY_DN561_c0_g1_i2:1-528(+)
MGVQLHNIFAIKNSLRRLAFKEFLKLQKTNKCTRILGKKYCLKKYQNLQNYLQNQFIYYYVKKTTTYISTKLLQNPLHLDPFKKRNTSSQTYQKIFLFCKSSSKVFISNTLQIYYLIFFFCLFQNYFIFLLFIPPKNIRTLSPRFTQKQIIPNNHQFFLSNNFFTDTNSQNPQKY